MMRIPHTPEKKRSIIAIQSESKPGIVTVYVKGAPEYLVQNCNAMVSSSQNGIDQCKP
jgi:magnesium-transporting ATPase (P-type)